MKNECTAMYREAVEAPAAVARLLAANGEACRELGARLRTSPPPFIATCARGSSDNAATYAKYLFETRCGIATLSHAPSISSLYQADIAMNGALFLAISQSGRSPDLLASAERAKDCGAYVVALCNDAASPLSDLAQLCLPLHAGAEISVAATKSFITALAAILQIAAAWSDDDALHPALDALPEQLQAAARLDWSHAAAAFYQADDLYVAGRGYSFPIAQEAALKFKETAQLHAEPFSAAEIQHGPMELLRHGFPVLVFAQNDQTRPGTEQLIRFMAKNGGRVYVAGTDIAEGCYLPVIRDVHPISAPITMIQSFYPFANAISVAREMNPDRPRHLSKVTETR